MLAIATITFIAPAQASLNIDPIFEAAIDTTRYTHWSDALKAVANLTQEELAAAREHQGDIIADTVKVRNDGAFIADVWFTDINDEQWAGKKLSVGQSLTVEVDGYWKVHVSIHGSGLAYGISIPDNVLTEDGYSSRTILLKGTTYSSHLDSYTE